MVRPFDVSLYVITDARVAAGRDQVEIIAAALRGGATMVQLRDDILPARELYKLGLRLQAVTRQAGAIFIVNDRVDLALAVDADGVHVGQTDIPPAVARRLLGPDRIVGVSAGSPAEYAAVEEQGADYLGVSPFAVTSTKADAGAAIGPEGIGRVRALTTLPIVAIGAVGPSNAADSIRAGANGIAVISAIVGQPDPEAAARRLRKIVAAAGE